MFILVLKSAGSLRLTARHHPEGSVTGAWTVKSKTKDSAVVAISDYEGRLAAWGCEVKLRNFGDFGSWWVLAISGLVEAISIGNAIDQNNLDLPRRRCSVRHRARPSDGAYLHRVLLGLPSTHFLH